MASENDNAAVVNARVNQQRLDALNGRQLAPVQLQGRGRGLSEADPNSSASSGDMAGVAGRIMRMMPNGQPPLFGPQRQRSLDENDEL